MSCQAEPDGPLYDPQITAAMAQAAEQGGAVAIRANGSDHIRAIKAAVRLLSSQNLPNVEAKNRRLLAKYRGRLRQSGV